MPSTLSARRVARGIPGHVLKAALFFSLAAIAPGAPAAAEMPQMGAVEWSVYKHPEYGCPTHADVFVSSYATHWSDGDTASHKITWTVERIGDTGKLHKYKSYAGAYVPKTEQNGKQVTEFASFDTGIAVGENVSFGYTNKFRLVIVAPFHWESEWNAITFSCF